MCIALRMLRRVRGKVTPAGRRLRASMWATVDSANEALLTSAKTIRLERSPTDSPERRKASPLRTVTVPMKTAVVRAELQFLSAATL